MNKNEIKYAHLDPRTTEIRRIFRIVDFLTSDEHRAKGVWENKLMSHIEHGLLSPLEMQDRSVPVYPAYNQIRDENLISVCTTRNDIDGVDEGSDGLIMFTNTFRHKAGVITEAPTIKNPETRGWKSMNHLVIDASEVPVEKRQVTGIIISQINIDCSESIDRILGIGKQKELPVYDASNWTLELIQ